MIWWAVFGFVGWAIIFIAAISFGKAAAKPWPKFPNRCELPHDPNEKSWDEPL